MGDASTRGRNYDLAIVAFLIIAALFTKRIAQAEGLIPLSLHRGRGDSTIFQAVDSQLNLTQTQSIVNSTQTGGETNTTNSSPANYTANASTMVNTEFVESGLPPGTFWNVTYDGSTNQTALANAGFSTPPGIYPFSVPALEVGNATYVPSPSSGGLPAGNSTSITFNMAVQRTVNSSMQTNSTLTILNSSPDRNTQLNNSAANASISQVQAINMSTVFSGTFTTQTGNLTVASPSLAVTNLTVSLDSNSISLNLTIRNQSQVPASLPAAPSTIYQFIQINGSVKAKSASGNIDQYVTKAVYNFSVPVEWLIENNISIGQVRLLKYYGSGWHSLPTTLTGWNSTAYFFSAVSNSLSAYVIGTSSTGSAQANSTGRENASAIAPILDFYHTKAISNTNAINARPLSPSGERYLLSSLSAEKISASTQNITMPYGSVRSNNTYYAANQSGHLYYLSENRTGVTIYNVTVTKASTPLAIKVDGYQVTAPGVHEIHLPIVNGHLGIRGPSYYWINGSLTASLLGNNREQFSYSIVLSNGTRLLPTRSANTSSVDYTFSYKIPVTVKANLTLDAAGNANYTAVDPSADTVPANILYYIPVTFTNYQSAAVAANTPIAVGTNSVTGNIIGFNAVAYKQYETCNLDNAEFFFSNGTIVTSWLEGNYISEDNANTLCTSSTSPNALVDSANVLYWVVVPSSTFLPADTGTPAQNTIYLGWAGNVVSSANTLFDGVYTGEAPQLTCPIPSKTKACTAANPYAEYDNGNEVFNIGNDGFYDNFVGKALNTTTDKWLGTHGGTVTVTVANSLELAVTSTNSGGIVSNTPDSGYPYWWEGLINTTTSSTDKQAGLEISTSNTFSTLGAGNVLGYESGYATSFNTVADINPITYNAVGKGFIGTHLTTAGTQPKVIGLDWPSTGSQVYGYGYTFVAGTNSLNAVGSQYFSIVVSESVSVTYDLFAQWVRARSAPPDDVLPGTTYGSPTLAPVYAGPASPLSATVYSGQSITLTADPYAGTPPYTINWFAQPNCGGAAVGSGESYDASPSSTTTYSYNAVDSGSPVTTACSSGDMVVVITPFVVGYTSSATSKAGNAITANAILVMTGPYTTNFFALSGSQTSSGATGNVITANVVLDSNSLVQYTATPRSANAVFLGHNTFGDASLKFIATTASNAVIVGVGANVTYQKNGVNGDFFTINGFATASPETLTYSATEANSFAIILYSLAGNSISGFATNAMSNPANGCSIDESTNQLGKAGEAAVSCNSLAVGSYNATLAPSFTSASYPYAIGAYVFPPYPVALVSNTASEGTITTDGGEVFSGAGAGNTIDIIGTNAITATPIGGSTFVGWSVSSGNLMVADPSASSTFLTVEGAGTLTANFQAAPATTPFYPTEVATNVMIDGQQYLGLTAYANNAVGSYTYNFIISNTITGNPIASQEFDGVSSNTETWIYQVPNSLATQGGNVIQANVIITNGASGTANSVYTPPLMISPQFLSTSWTSSNTATTETLTSTIAGGTNSITYAQFSGSGSYINLGNPTSLQITNEITISVWAYIDPSQANSGTGYPSILDKGGNSNQQGYGLGIFASGAGMTAPFNGLCLMSNSNDYIVGNIPMQSGWNNIVCTYDGSYLDMYINGALDPKSVPGTGAIPQDNYNAIIGGDSTPGSPSELFTGGIANLQVYNTSLTSDQVNSLFQEGITGGPVAFNSLAGWWLLNGNTGDYSRNNNVGTPTGVTYATTHNAFTYNFLVYNSIGGLVESFVAPNLSATSNTLSFPTIGMPSGTYTANIVAYDSATSRSIATNTLTYSIAGTATCTISLSNTLIDFGGGAGVPAGSSSGITNTIVDTNSGTADAWLWIEGGNWIGPQTADDGNYFVANTLWSAALNGAGTRLELPPGSNTEVFLPSSGSNSIFLGANVPTGVLPGTFEQTITLINTC